MCHEGESNASQVLIYEYIIFHSTEKKKILTKYGRFLFFLRENEKLIIIIMFSSLQKKNGKIQTW